MYGTIVASATPAAMAPPFSLAASGSSLAATNATRMAPTSTGALSGWT